MGKHEEWRKIAKKMRRKRIRSYRAAERDEMEKQWMDGISDTPYYKTWLAEQEALDLLRLQEEKRASILAHEKWEYMEILAQEKWTCRQKLLLEEETKKKETEELIRKEWEAEEEKERLRKEAKENEERKKQLLYEKLMAEMELFIDGTGAKPAALYTTCESNPGKEPCQFFTKVGSCRFRDSCSRNHIRPAISKIILLPGLYSHISLEVGTQGEYGTDINLEYDHNERYRDFEEFFDDITPELEKYGRINTIRVCSNTEPHLRGNVYVAYQSERSAAAAYKALNGRYYAGRMISVEFVNLISWKSAACGLQFRGKCPKGSKCNFLHVFRNPRGQFSYFEEPTPTNNKSSTPAGGDWRWTPSPERDLNGRTSSQRSNGWEDERVDENGKPDRTQSSRRGVRRSEASERRNARSCSSDSKSRKSDSERPNEHRDQSRSRSKSKRSRTNDLTHRRREKKHSGRSKMR